MLQKETNPNRKSRLDEKQYGYRPNTMGNIIKNLKMTMEKAAEDGLHTNYEFKGKNFAKPGNSVFNIALTLEEVLSLYHLDLSNNKLQSDVRDLFLIGVETAQRFSDYSNIEKDMIEGNILSIHQKKTKTDVDIPMSDMLKAILVRRSYVLPSISDTMLNKTIKVVAFKAGITKMERFTEIIGGVEVKRKAPRYSLISSHTARRTGATLLYMSNAGIIETMLITGHQAQKELLNYIKLPKGYNRTESEKVDFYNKLKNQIDK
jgi:integrase